MLTGASIPPKAHGATSPSIPTPSLSPSPLPSPLFPSPPLEAGGPGVLKFYIAVGEF